jgi:Ca2+-binding RTX toxin-like protein
MASIWLLCVGALTWPASSSATVACSYSGADHRLTVNTLSDTSEITRSGDSIAVKDLFTPTATSCSGGTPTVFNTDQVTVVGGISTDISLSGGPFAPGASPDPDGSSEIQFAAVGDGIVYVDGTAGRDVWAWGAPPPGGGPPLGFPSAALNTNFGVDGDQDVEVSADPSQIGFIVASPGRGADLVEPQPDSVGFLSFSNGGAGNDTLIGTPSGGILEGGNGRDTIIGGARSDLISGGHGKDRISAGAGGDEIGTVDGAKDRVACGGGRDRVRADAKDKLHGCELVKRVTVSRPAAASAAATRDEYVAQADPICASTIAAQAEAEGGVGTIGRLIRRGRLKAAARRFRALIAAFGDGVEQLATISPPTQDGWLIGSWIAMLRAQVPLGMEVAGALNRGHTSGRPFKRLVILDAQTRRLVANYGFHSCQDL